MVWRILIESAYIAIRTVDMTRGKLVAMPTDQSSKWVSSFLTAHQHIIGYSVPYNGLENAIKDGKYNQGYLAMIKYE